MTIFMMNDGAQRKKWHAGAAAGIGAAVVCVFLVLAYASQAAADKKITLRYVFKPGQKMNYGMNIDGSVTVKVQRAGEANVPHNTALVNGSFGYLQEVVEVNPQDKSGTLRITYAEAQLQTKIGDQTIANQDVTSLAGKIALLRVAPNGEVLSQEIPQALPPTFQNADFTKMFVVFPPEEISVGQRWSRPASTSVDDNENFRTESESTTVYTLAGIEKRNRLTCAKVEVATDTQATTVSHHPEMKFDGKMTGRVEGAVYYDIVTGFAVFSDLTIWLYNEVSTAGAEGTADPGPTVTMLETKLRTITERR